MQLKQILDELVSLNASYLLECGRRGIEKEGLRYTLDDNLSNTLHPKSLGSPLTHKEITTDYAESLIELVTPAFRNSKDTLSHLCYLHRVIASNNNEYILNSSIPAYINDIESVKVGEYGSSNAGKMRNLYRKGLALRYGKSMQLISGIHFNYSICDDLFLHYAKILNQDFNQDFINNKYMNMIRNIREYAWIISYLFGHSPAVDKSFFQNKTHNLDTLDNDTLYLPYATSLRMSDIGYQNKTENLVSANSLDEYIKDLKSAVNIPSKTYQKYGLKDNIGNYQQINTNLLQIENEYYTVVRPKQIIKSGEAPISALQKHGISYIELRTIDINCFEPTGISQNQLDFLELYMLFCLFIDNPKLSDKDEKNAKANMAKTSCCGRDPNLKLNNKDKKISIKEWGTEILDAMRPIAEAMDIEKHRPHYISIIERNMKMIKNPELTPSAKIISILKGEKGEKAKTYHQFITELSKEKMNLSRIAGITEAEKLKVKIDAEKSLITEKELLKKSENVTFEQYLNNYFQQLK